MFTGHILALPVFYGVLNVLVMGLSALIDNALSILLLGYAGSNAMYSDLTVWLTPAWFLHESWIRPVFQNGVGVCVGLTLGTVLYNYFFQGLGAWGFVLLVSLCAVAGAFIGRMFLKKTLRVFAEGWRACVVLGLCMLALLGGARADLLAISGGPPIRSGWRA